MEKVLSNLLKKPEPLNDIHLVVGDPGSKELYKVTYIYIQKIIPDRIVMDKAVYEITYLHEEYHLDGFEVSTENGKVMNIRVFGYHPNCDSNTDNFCLPDFKKNVDFTTEYLNMIYANIKTYYMDNCFFNHLGRKVRYKKMKSMYVQLNNEEKS